MHCLLWVMDAPDIQRAIETDESANALKEYVDSLISTAVPLRRETNSQSNSKNKVVHKSDGVIKDDMIGDIVCLVDVTNACSVQSFQLKYVVMQTEDRPMSLQIT